MVVVSRFGGHGPYLALSQTDVKLNDFLNYINYDYKISRHKNIL